MTLETLADVVAELTAPHPRTVETPEGDTHTGVEEALLVLLRAAVGSSLGRGSAAGVKGEGSPLDLSAMELWAEVERTVTAWTLQAHRPGQLVATVAQLGAQATRADVDPTWAVEFREHALRWRDGVRALLEPVKTTDLRGVACPGCGNQYARQQQDGEVLRRPALHVTFSDPPVAVCLVCLSTWVGGELLDLQAGKLS